MLPLEIYVGRIQSFIVVSHPSASAALDTVYRYYSYAYETLPHPRH